MGPGFAFDDFAFRLLLCLFPATAVDADFFFAGDSWYAGLGFLGLNGIGLARFGAALELVTVEPDGGSDSDSSPSSRSWSISSAFLFPFDSVAPFAGSLDVDAGLSLGSEPFEGNELAFGLNIG